MTILSLAALRPTVAPAMAVRRRASVSCRRAAPALPTAALSRRRLRPRLGRTNANNDNKSRANFLSVLVPCFPAQTMMPPRSFNHLAHVRVDAREMPSRRPLASIGRALPRPSHARPQTIQNHQQRPQRANLNSSPSFGPLLNLTPSRPCNHLPARVHCCHGSDGSCRYAPLPASLIRGQGGRAAAALPSQPRTNQKQQQGPHMYSFPFPSSARRLCVLEGTRRRQARHAAEAFRGRAWPIVPATSSSI
jgi:hypothetical protein